MSHSESEIRELVRRIVLQVMRGANLADKGLSEQGSAPAAEHAIKRGIIGEAEVQAARPGSELQVASDALVTPLARQLAMERGVRLVESQGPADAPAVPAPEAKLGKAGAKCVALGADHGGYELKERLKTFLADEGYAVIDCGTNSKDPVDYPDFAYAVAKLVAEGQAWRGIVVDGAGIGSCMAANKVPGVRAAMCYDVSTATNAREHNDANVLTLGGGFIGDNLARHIVKTFLTTEFGGGRHARRVDKIMEIERRFLR